MKTILFSISWIMILWLVLIFKKPFDFLWSKTQRNPLLVRIPLESAYGVLIYVLISIPQIFLLDSEKFINSIIMDLPKVGSWSIEAVCLAEFIIYLLKLRSNKLKQFLINPPENKK
jgi:hypothetical protein